MITEIIIIFLAGGLTSALVTFIPTLNRLKQQKVLKHRIVTNPIRCFFTWVSVASVMLPLVLPSLLSSKTNDKLITSLMRLDA